MKPFFQETSTVIVENGEEIVKVNNMQVPNGINHQKHLNGKTIFFKDIINTSKNTSFELIRLLIIFKR